MTGNFSHQLAEIHDLCVISYEQSLMQQILDAVCKVEFRKAELPEPFLMF